MKFLMIFLMIALSYSHVSSDPCTWSRNLTATISKLTPAGKITVQKILTDLNVLVSAGIQPIWNATISMFSVNSSSKSLLNVDQVKLKALRTQLCINNIPCSITYLKNYCVSWNKTVSLVAAFSTEDKQLINQVLNTFNYYSATVYPIITSINQFLDASLFALVTKSESASLLNRLNILYNNFGQ